MESKFISKTIGVLLPSILLVFGCSTTNIKKELIMDTTKSDKIVHDFYQQETKFKRLSTEFSGTVQATAQEVFPLLCPAREADWIPGWNAKLLYTESGYAEDKCIFATDSSNPAGEGTWIFTDYKQNEYIEFVRFQTDLVSYFKVSVTDNQDGYCTVTWKPVYTALTAKGNDIIDKLAEQSKHKQGGAGKAHSSLINTYFAKGENNQESDKIVNAYFNEEIKLTRRCLKFSATWKASVSEIFSLFSASREADWLTGWTAKLIYTESGQAEDKYVFTTTEKTHSMMDVRTWIFPDFKKNEYLNFVDCGNNTLIYCNLSVKDNGNGTTTATWDATATALNEKGNKEVNKLPDAKTREKALGKMIGHYLKTGKTINKFSLMMHMIFGSNKK